MDAFIFKKSFFLKSITGVKITSSNKRIIIIEIFRTNTYKGIHP